MAGGIQLSVAAAVLLRSVERKPASVPDLAAAVPSLAAGALVFAAGHGQPWTPPAIAAAGIGAGIAVLGLASLGRSFAVLPGVRRLQTRGLYRFVRHPIYLGELLFLAAAASRLGRPGAAAVAVVIPLLAWRILVEERLLADEPGWDAWARLVRWRLLPGLW